MTKTEGGCTLAPQQRAVEAFWGKLLGRPSLHMLGCLKDLRLVFSSPSHVHHGPEGFSIARRHTQTHTFSMGCMHDYIYCTKSSWS